MKIVDSLGGKPAVVARKHRRYVVQISLQRNGRLLGKAVPYLSEQQVQLLRSYGTLALLCWNEQEARRLCGLTVGDGHHNNPWHEGPERVYAVAVDDRGRIITTNILG